MRSSATALRASLAGILLAGLAYAAPASATALTQWTWDLGASGTNGHTKCTQIKPTSSGCLGESSSGATNGNVDSFTSEALTVGGTTQAVKSITAAAYELPMYTSGANKYQQYGTLKTGFLGYYADTSTTQYGLGVEKNVGSPDHSVDNNCPVRSGGSCQFDLVVFKMPTGTNFNQLTVSLSPFGGTENMEATFFYGTPTAALAAKIAAESANSSANDPMGFAGLSVADLLSGGFTETSITGMFLNDSTVESVQLTSTSTISYLIVAANITPQRNGNDDFKISAIAGTNVTPPAYPKCSIVTTGITKKCPEPVTLSIFGTGLAGAAALRRRRKTAKTA